MKTRLFPAVCLFFLLPSLKQSLQAQSWNLNGNAVNNVNFLGTTNNRPLIFKTNNEERMRITRYGQLGIGLINPNYPLHISNPTYSIGANVINTFFGTEDRIGLYSSSINSDGWGFGLQAYGGYYGVYGQANGGTYTGSVYGTYGAAYGSSAGSRYGVYGYAGGGTFNAAGYFDGDVWAYNYYYISDRKVKTGITILQNSLAQLMKLKPSAYEFNQSEYSSMALPTGKQFGLVADEVKQVFPELVKAGVHPARYGKDKTEVINQELKFEGVNYTGFIPVLIASIQEQQKMIDAMKADNAALKSENKELKLRIDKIDQMLVSNGVAEVSLTSAKLEQNSPNPFNQRTTINYFLPNKANAQISISNANGIVLKNISLNAVGKGQAVIEASQLLSGTYQYSLVVEGKVIDTKKMVLTK